MRSVSPSEPSIACFTTIRGGSSQTRARVLKIAERLQYQPNVAARNLKLNRRVRLAIHLPREIASFFDPLRDGVRAAAALAHNVKVDLGFRTYPRLGDGDVQLMKEDIGREYDGIVITPGDPAAIVPMIRQFVAKGTAVVCVASGAPRSERLTWFQWMPRSAAVLPQSYSEEQFARKVRSQRSPEISAPLITVRSCADSLRRLRRSRHT